MSHSQPPEPRALAYVVSQYPKLSEAFVIREILQLKRLGFRIEVASINSPDRSGKALTQDEISETASTYYVIPHGVLGALMGHVHGIVSETAGYLRGLKHVFRLGKFDLRALAMNLFYMTEALMIGRWMKRRGFRHVHAHLGSQAATVGWFVKAVFGFGYSITVHGPDEFYDAHRHYLTEKVIAADFVVCISNFARSQLMKLSPYQHWAKLVVSRLGIDPNIFVPAPARAPRDTFEIICVGRLAPAKGQHLLLDAVAQMRAQGRSVRLRLVGDGSDRPSLEAQARALALGDACVFEGPVNQDRIRELYQQADCFCIPSFAEGIPVVLMEAMAMAIPCVSTHITGIPELIRTGQDGLLVAPSDLEGLTSALCRLMDNPQERALMGRQGRERVMAQYDLAANVQRLATIFSERVAAVR
jgi:colanic acid/amylovoran biosynthesis glycosyltransferase